MTTMTKSSYATDTAKGRFGPSLANAAHPGQNTPYPAEMRTQLWPLCCGGKIISGFKDVGNYTDDELVTKIKEVLNWTPDMQVFGGEGLRPVLCFLTLNSGQLASPKIIEAVETVGFQRFATSMSMSGQQGWFVFDPSGEFKLTELKPWG